MRHCGRCVSRKLRLCGASSRPFNFLPRVARRYLRGATPGRWLTVLPLLTATPFHLLKCWNPWPIHVSFLSGLLFLFQTLYSFDRSGACQSFLRSILVFPPGTGFHSIHSLHIRQRNILKMFSQRQILALALALSSASAACVPRGESGSETTPTSAAPSVVASDLPVQAVAASSASSASAPAATSSSVASSDGTKYFAVL